MSFWNFGGNNQNQAQATDKIAHQTDEFPFTPSAQAATTAATTIAQQTASSVGVFTGTSSTSEFQVPLGPSTTAESLSTTPTTTVGLISITGSSSAFGYFSSLWIVPGFGVNEAGLVLYSVRQWPNSISGVAYNPVLFACQTNASSGASMTSENTWSIAQISGACGDNGTSCPNDTQIPKSVEFELGFPNTHLAQNYNFFFCIGNEPQYINQLVCNTYSPFFSINGLIAKRDLAPTQAMASATALPTTALAIPTYIPAVSVSGAQSVATAPFSTIISSTATTTIPSSSTTITSTAASSATSSASTVSSTTKSGLSTGAKAGIALGSVIFLGILLLAALLLCRKRNQRSSRTVTPPETMMLTRDMHQDSFSRPALITEKETSGANSNGNLVETPIDDILPIQRHSALAPYETLPTAPMPYNGPAAPSSPIRRKPTAASAVSGISGPSVSPRSVSSPRSITIPNSSSPSEQFEEYHDTPMPVYGDARHSPHVYSVAEGRGLGMGEGSRSPFLAEEGMSADEVARLEEEERRIDAAIAEAERRR